MDGTEALPRGNGEREGDEMTLPRGKREGIVVSSAADGPAMPHDGHPGGGAVRYRPSETARIDHITVSTGAAPHDANQALAATAIIGAIILIVTQAGPLIAPNVRLYAFVGYALGFVGFVLALRAVIRLFARARW